MTQWLILAVVVALLIGLSLWIKSILTGDDDTANTDHEMLSQILELKRRGELSPEEFRSIKGQLTTRIHRQELPLGVPAASSKSPEDETS